jgi:uncharacterized protein with PQ loop repeat
MAPVPKFQVHFGSRADALMQRALGSMSVFTMLMTLPQIAAIWWHHEATGVSIASWSAYLVSALLWLRHGIMERDKNIYLPCIGWIVLDSAVIIGAVLYA